MRGYATCQGGFSSWAWILPGDKPTSGMDSNPAWRRIFRGMIYGQRGGGRGAYLGLRVQRMSLECLPASGIIRGFLSRSRACGPWGDQPVPSWP